MSQFTDVLFDLDGTLVDSFEGIASAYHHLLTELELGDMDDADIAKFVGPPIQQVLEQHFGLTGPRLHEGIRAFRDYYGSEGLLRFTKYPGVEEMLHELREDGYRLNIATSKLQIMAMEVVRCAGWANLFNVVGGAEADGSRHVKVDVIEWTLSQLGDRPQVVAMVGDRAADIEGARALGLVGIGVSWGYGSRHELSEAGAFSTTDSPDQLLKALRGFG